MENKVNSSIKVVNLSGGYILPKVTETKGRKKWVEIGIDGADDFFVTLINRYETSPTNQSCIDGTTDLIYGKGLKGKNEDRLEEYLYSLTDDEEIKKIVYDYKMFGNGAIQLVFEDDLKTIKNFFHLPVDTLRAEKVAEDGRVHGYYYSSDWGDTRIKPVRIPCFGEPDFAMDNVQLIYFKRYSPGKFYYGIPDYYSSIQYCAVEEEISNLHINNILNNFMPSTILNFNSGLPPVEEQYLIENSIKAKFTGTTNAGRFILSFNENPESKTTVEMLKPENLHEHDEFLAEEASRKVMLAHRITSQLLFGIKTASGFSSNADELKISYEIFTSMVINPMQEEVLKQIAAILEHNNVDPSGLYFAPLIPFGFLSEMVEQVGGTMAQKIIENPNESPDLADRSAETEPGFVSDREIVGYGPTPSNLESEVSVINDNLKNMTGRQHQQLLRIINQFQKNRLNESQAIQMLKSAFGFSDQEAKNMLGITEEQQVEMRSQYIDQDWNSWELEHNYEINK